MSRCAIILLFSVLAGCGKPVSLEPRLITAAPSSASSAVGLPDALHRSAANAIVLTTYSNSGTGGVAAFTEQGGALAIQFPYVNRPIRLAYDPHDRLVYVLNYAKGSDSFVTAYDVQGNQHALSGGFPNVQYPSGIAYDAHDGFVYVANVPPGKQPTVSAYDEQGTPQRLSGHFASLGPQRDIAFDPNNDFIYVADGKTILAFDEQGNKQKLSGAFLDAASPSSLTFDPHEGALYATQSVQGGTVVVYDEEGRLKKLSPGFGSVDPVAVAYDPDSNLIYVAQAASDRINGRVRIYDEQGTPQPLHGRFGGIAIGDIIVAR
ncbi:MAG: hypothetical protein M3R51_00835 [Candidatus Eremiobacteraeota bacterium]|nr:hypothetical protein [Candidatus Eremiobacteraeota bacterium]